MYTLDYDDKVDVKSSRRAAAIDTSCPLLGGKVNFICFVKKLNKIISGLKYDVHTLNNLLHGIKFARM
jgi:hypothetical protein